MNTSGWNLQQGTLPFRPLSETDVIRIVNLALSPAKKPTSQRATMTAVERVLFDFLQEIWL